MNEQVNTIIKTGIIEPIIKYLQKEKNIKLTDDDLDKIFTKKKEITNTTNKFTNENESVKKQIHNNLPSNDDQCIYIYQKKKDKKGQQCTKQAKYYGYCNQHKNTVSAKKEIEKRKQMENNRELVPKVSTNKPKPKVETPKIIEPSNPEDLKSSEEDEEIHLLYEGDPSLYVRPSLKHICSIREEGGEFKIVWMYKYNNGKWGIPSENEIKGIDLIDSKYVTTDYNKLNPTEHLVIVKKEANIEKNPFYTETIKREIGLI